MQKVIHFFCAEFCNNSSVNLRNFTTIQNGNMEWYFLRLYSEALSNKMKFFLLGVVGSEVLNQETRKKDFSYRLSEIYCRSQ